MSLKKYLEDRIAQQEQRAFLIPKYIDHSDKWLGKNDYKMEDVVAIKQDIEECRVALKAVVEHQKLKKEQSENPFKQALL